MTKSGTGLAAFGAAALGIAMLYASPAAAQGQSRSWVAANGDNANPCTEALPCKTFQRAINRTMDGGEVNCLDSGGFGSALISKSISIICDRSEAGVISTSEGFVIAGPPEIIVTIAGLDFDGLGQSAAGGGYVGVLFVSGGVLHVHDVKMRGFRPGFGLLFAPITNAQLLIENVTVSEGGCGCSRDSGGIGIYPGTDVQVRASIFGLTAVNNVNAGLRFDTSMSTGASINATVANSRFAQNNLGVVVRVPAGTGSADVTLKDVVTTQNSIYGVVFTGPTVTGRADGVTSTGNGTGVATTGGATLNSFGTNTLGGNTTNGAFTLPVLSKN
jgi:hypothetical protein